MCTMGTEQINFDVCVCVCDLYPPPLSYANVHNYYSPYAYCSLDKGVVYTRGGGWCYL